MFSESRSWFFTAATTHHLLVGLEDRKEVLLGRAASKQLTERTCTSKSMTIPKPELKLFCVLVLTDVSDVVLGFDSLNAWFACSYFVYNLEV